MAEKKKHKELTESQVAELDELFEKAHAALAIIETYDQAKVDRLCQAVAWAVANTTTFHRLVEMGIEESGLGDYTSRMNKRMKIRGVLRDALRQPSVGIVEERSPRRASSSTASRPASSAASCPPPTPTSPPPATRSTPSRPATSSSSPAPALEGDDDGDGPAHARGAEAEGAPADILQCITQPSLLMSQAPAKRADLIIATGGQALVRQAYSSGKPAFGVGAGNATEFLDETADVKATAMNCMLSKTSDPGSGCSADGNVLVPQAMYNDMLDALEEVGGYRASAEQREKLDKVMWDAEGHRLADTVAIASQKLAEAAGFEIPEDAKFIFVEGTGIGDEHNFCKEKLTTLMAVHPLQAPRTKSNWKLYDVGGKGHSCGIASTNDEHIDYFGKKMPVSRTTVNQPNSRANAGKDKK